MSIMDQKISERVVDCIQFWGHRKNWRILNLLSFFSVIPHILLLLTTGSLSWRMGWHHKSRVLDAGFELYLWQCRRNIFPVGRYMDLAWCWLYCVQDLGDEVSLHECLLYMTRSVPVDLAVNSPIDPGPNRSLYKLSALKEYEPRMFNRSETCHTDVGGMDHGVFIGSVNVSRVPQGMDPMRYKRVTKFANADLLV